MCWWLFHCFLHRGDTEAKREAVAEATRAANPAEINIDDDEDEDSEEEVDGKRT